MVEKHTNTYRHQLFIIVLILTLLLEVLMVHSATSESNSSTFNQTETLTQERLESIERMQAAYDLTAQRKAAAQRFTQNYRLAILNITPQTDSTNAPQTGTSQSQSTDLPSQNNLNTNTNQADTQINNVQTPSENLQNDLITIGTQKDETEQTLSDKDVGKTDSQATNPLIQTMSVMIILVGVLLLTILFIYSYKKKHGENK